VGGCRIGDSRPALTAIATATAPRTLAPVQIAPPACCSPAVRLSGMPVEVL
jgi:hypothetical protein